MNGGSICTGCRDAMWQPTAPPRASGGHAGPPPALSVVCHGIFEPWRRKPLAPEQALAGGPLPAPLGHVLRELGITLSQVHSPQAKGWEEAFPPKEGARLKIN